MQRIAAVDPETATGQTQELLDATQSALGVLPNSTRIMANSPPVLKSFLHFHKTMSDVSIGGKLHNQLKLLTSESNNCNYCTSLLHDIGPKAGLTESDILEGRAGTTEDSRTTAALQFAKQVMENHGSVSDEELKRVRDAGYNDAEIVEMIGSVVLGCFTNFLNNVANTELDIAAAPALK